MRDHQEIEQSCGDFLLFLRTILRPAAEEFEARLFAKDMRLHHVFQTNVLAAHMIDYLVAIQKAAGKEVTRRELVREFDRLYAVEGAEYLNRKFQLVDAVNNALKHIELDKQRGTNQEPIQQYGPIGFRCLREEGGLVLFGAGKYRFDFARVALRPVLAVVTPREFEEVEDVVDFALGRCADADVLDAYDDDPDPIDQMIDYCNPTCLDCGEGGDDCRCSEFRYDGKSGDFRGNWDESFDFDAVMSRISGAYSSD